MDVRLVNNDSGVITAATLEKSKGWRKPLHVTQITPSGDVYPQRSSSVNYGRVNVTTAATKILSSNPNRLGLLVQNAEGQQIGIGFSSTLTMASPGGVLSPSLGSSGDGGILTVSDYTGEVWGVVASGDGDVFYQEFV